MNFLITFQNANKHNLVDKRWQLRKDQTHQRNYLTPPTQDQHTANTSQFANKEVLVRKRDVNGKLN